jgi:tRNA pseudouridine38-40 synthase
MPSFRLTLAYDGTCFAGSQAQPGQRTVQGELDRALAELAEGSVTTSFAGRTDRGVHATGQVAAARIATWHAPASALQRALNARLPADVAVLDVTECDDAFNPRFAAAWREYHYRIGPQLLCPFLRRYAWALRGDIEVARVAIAAARFVGTHDFATFAGRGEGVPWSERARRRQGTTRTLLRCDWRWVDGASAPGTASDSRLLEIRVAADGFLPRMVRNIVAALVEVGQGRRDPAWIDELLGARDRRCGAGLAPAHGLTLSRVGFGDDEPDVWQPTNLEEGARGWSDEPGRQNWMI